MLDSLKVSSELNILRAKFRGILEKSTGNVQYLKGSFLERESISIPLGGTKKELKD